MNLSREELRRLALPLAAALAMLAAGVALISVAEGARKRAEAGLRVAEQERRQAAQRLAHIAEEEREVRAKLAVYQRLQELNVLGEERRLEWADALSRIRSQRELLDLRYRVERQRLLTSVAGKPAGVDFYASTMRAELALLHEEDLLRFLADLRASGNAYHAVRRCAIDRTGQQADGTGLVPRLRADCEIDLITIMDRAAKR